MRPPYQKAGKPKKARKPMRKVSAKRAAYRASPEGQAALEYMGTVRTLACSCCGRPGPSEAHHCIHGRYSARKVSDFETIPLCQKCHRELHDDKPAWAAKYGPDYGFIDATREAVRLAQEIDF